MRFWTGVFLFSGCLLLIGCERPKAGEAPNTAAAMAGLHEPSDKQVVCFVYHRFGDGRYPATNVSVTDFEAHLKYLVAAGYQVLSLSAALKYLTTDAPSQKTAVITVDDGYKSFLTHGLPLLQEYHAQATLFINTETVGASDYMSWEDLKSLPASVEIGNHTHSHAYFLNEPAPARYTLFKAELAKSQALIQTHLQVTPTVFAYPYGEYDTTMIKLVKAAGFTAAAAQHSGVFTAYTNLFRIPRFPMSEAYAALAQFKEKAATHALPVVAETPETPLLASADGHTPTLTVTVDARHLQTNQLQCFIQGNTCAVRTEAGADSVLTLSLTPNAPLTRRRTLYTLTMPGKDGTWYWYSHLWINPTVK